MGLTTYVMLLFGISIALFFIGYKPILFTLMQCNTADPTCTTTGNFAGPALDDILTSIINNPAVLGLAGLAVLTSVLLGGSFAVMYIIPILMLFAISNFLLLPTDFLLQSGDFLPWEIKIIIFGFLNLMLLLTVITFVRGGE